MTTYAYVRISSLKQEEGFGKEVQRNAIYVFATINKLTPVEWHEETKSGENFKDREVFQAIRAKLVAGDSIIVYKLDRFSRHMIETEVMLGELFERGVRVHSTQTAEQGWLDPERFNDPQSVFIRRIVAAASEYDKSLLLGRMQSGLKAKAAKGGFAGGVPPFGYKIVDGDLAIDEEKRDAVMEVLRMDAMMRNPLTIARHMKTHFDQVRTYSKDPNSTQTMTWDNHTIERIIARRMLYTQGRYKDRNSEVELQRDDLIMARL